MEHILVYTKVPRANLPVDIKQLQQLFRQQIFRSVRVEEVSDEEGIPLEQGSDIPMEQGSDDKTGNMQVGASDGPGSSVGQASDRTGVLNLKVRKRCKKVMFVISLIRIYISGGS